MKCNGGIFPVPSSNKGGARTRAGEIERERERERERESDSMQLPLPEISQSPGKVTAM